MLVDDFVMLGTAVPEARKDGRVIVCSIGASEQYEKLIRIWPLAVQGCPKRWSVSKVELERNPEDSREDSYRIAEDKSFETGDAVDPWINEQFALQAKKYPEKKRTDLLAQHVASGLRELNYLQLSIGLLYPVSLELMFRDNWEEKGHLETPLAVFDSNPPKHLPLDIPVKKRFRYTPILKFRDEDGSEHKWQVRDWGGFEWMRKNGDERRFELAQSWHLDKPRILLVGNFNRQRRNWLVVSILRDLEVS